MKVSLLKFSLFFVVCSLFCVIGNAQITNIVGAWKTFDDTEKDANGNAAPKSIIEIWKAEKDETIDGFKYRKGAFYGKITKVFDPKNQNSVCTKCPKSDIRYNKKVTGLVIVSGLLKLEANLWKADKSILDPNNGKIYDCSMWIDGGKLKVRGYIGLFYRTQTWLKI